MQNWNSVLAKNRKKIDAAIDQIFNAGGDVRFKRNAEEPISKENSGIGGVFQNDYIRVYF